MKDDLRVRAANDAPVRPKRSYVLYWMTAQRRTRYHFGLERAVGWAEELGLPLVILEALRCDYRWASDRLHRFVLDGMADNAAALERKPVLYYPYVEPEQGAGKGLLGQLGRRAAVVVGDDFPSFFLPRMLAAAAKELDVRLEAVDANGLLPLAATERVFPTAYAFRRFLQKELPPFLEALPAPDPLAGVELPALDALPRTISRKWPCASDELLAGKPEALARLPINHEVPATGTRGGERAGHELLRSFIKERLERYPDRNQPEAEATSGLSPYLHFGHVSAHEVFVRLVEKEDWSPSELASTSAGKRTGWWNMSAASEGFLDQLITWRELGYHFAAKVPHHDRYESLPDWALATLSKHAADPRPSVYALEDFERAETHDELWNAAQRQLVREGRIHNYLRMVWGKKILEWSATPREALDVMIELNDRYALDGRNPNSTSGIFWILGRFDRPWGPERPIFGTVRYMTTANTARKVRVRSYLERYGPRGLFS